MRELTKEDLRLLELNIGYLREAIFEGRFDAAKLHLDRIVIELEIIRTFLFENTSKKIINEEDELPF